MQVKLQKWGNSLGVRIPSNIVKSMKLNKDDVLDIENVDGKIIISIIKKKSVSLKELFKNYKGENLTKEFSWDVPQGKEIW